jgi:hypothetical protein
MLIEIPIPFLREIETSDLKFIQNYKKNPTPKAIQSKKSNAGGIAIPDFKFCCRAIGTKAAWYWSKINMQHME